MAAGLRYWPQVRAHALVSDERSGCEAEVSAGLHRDEI